jgi:hypothetical protein
LYAELFQIPFTEESDGYLHTEALGGVKTFALGGYRLLVSAKREPWGQTVTRFLGPEGLLVGVTHTPSMRGG